MNNLQSFYSKILSSQKDCTQLPQLLRMFEDGEETRNPNPGFDVEDYVHQTLTTFRPLKHSADKNGDINNVQTRDTLQSLVQSCRCGNRAEDSYSPLDECKHHHNQQKEMIISDHNYLMSFLEKNIGFTPHNSCSPSITFEQGKPTASEKEAMKRKRRIRWTQDLHNRFIDSVDRLGGPKKATPKAILKLMNCSELTIFQIKSHLQKHRVARLIPNSTEGDIAEEIGSKTGVQIVEALRLQIDVQRRLYEQLESQKKLQLRIEEQAQQLHTMIQCQLNTK